MPKYQIVIADADLAHAQEIARNVEANVKVHGEAHRAKVAKMISARFPAPREAGTVHDQADTDCPDGGTNCRNCGDPVYADACKAAGHCQACGTSHGIAPDATLKANGYVLKAL